MVASQKAEREEKVGKMTIDAAKLPLFLDRVRIQFDIFTAQVLEFDLGGYVYQPGQSTNAKPVFLRGYPA